MGISPKKDFRCPYREAAPELKTVAAAPPGIVMAGQAPGPRPMRSPAPCTSAPAPPPNVLHRLMHLRRRARVTEADELVAIGRIEIDARRHRDVGLLQHALG